MTTKARPRRDLQALLLFVLSGITQYLGAALAVGLFAAMPAPTVAWLRIAISAVLLLAWRRPWRRPWTGRTLGVAALFGLFLAGMNIAFYVAIARLPLGTAVAIEFLGPVGVAAATGRSWRDRAGIALAALGVALLAGVTLRGGPEVQVGLVAILLAATAWAAYIVLGRRIATGQDGLSSLSIGMAAGALVFAPFCIGGAGPAVQSRENALAVLGIALLSSVIPYAIDQVVLKRISAARFAILLSLLPATAAATGALVLGQWPGPMELLGMGLVSAAIALAGASAAET